MSSGDGGGREEAEQPSAWDLESSEQVGDYGIFNVRRLRSRSPRTGQTHTRHVLSMPDWVDVVAETEDGRLVMVEQYRHGVGDVVLEFPSGIIEPGEDPAEAGRRELEEETGWSASAVERIGMTEPNSAIQDNLMHIVLASGCTADGREDQDDGEDVHTRLVGPEEIPDLIASGIISHALAVATWYTYAHHKNWLNVGAEKAAARRDGA